MAIGAMVNATLFGKKELLGLQVGNENNNPLPPIFFVSVHRYPARIV